MHWQFYSGKVAKGGVTAARADKQQPATDDAAPVSVAKKNGDVTSLAAGKAAMTAGAR